MGSLYEDLRIGSPRFAPSSSLSRCEGTEARFSGSGSVSHSRCSKLSLWLMFCFLSIAMSHGADIPGTPQSPENAVAEEANDDAAAEPATEGDLLLMQPGPSTLRGLNTLLAGDFPPAVIVIAIALGIAFFAAGGVIGRSLASRGDRTKKELDEKCAEQEAVLKELEKEYADVQRQIAEEEQREKELRSELEKYKDHGALLEAKQKEIEKLREAVEQSKKIEEEVSRLKEQLSELNQELEKRAETPEAQEFLREYKFLQEKIEETRSRALTSPVLPDESEIDRLREELKAKEAEQARLEAAIEDRLPLERQRDALILQIQETQDRVDELEKQAAELAAEGKGHDPRSVEETVQYWDLVEESRMLQERENYRAIMRAIREVRILVNAVNEYVEKGEPGVEGFRKAFAFMDRIEDIVADGEPTTAEVTAALADALPDPPEHMQKEQRALDRKLASLTCVVMPSQVPRTLKETDVEQDFLRKTKGELEANQKAGTAAADPTKASDGVLDLFREIGKAALQTFLKDEEGKSVLLVESINAVDSELALPAVQSIPTSEFAGVASTGAMFDCELPSSLKEKLNVKKAVVNIPLFFAPPTATPAEIEELVERDLARRKDQYSVLVGLKKQDESLAEAATAAGLWLPLADVKLQGEKIYEVFEHDGAKIVALRILNIYPESKGSVSTFWSKKLTMGAKAYAAHRLLLTAVALHHINLCANGIGLDSVVLGPNKTVLFGNTGNFAPEGSLVTPKNITLLPPEDMRRILNGQPVSSSKKSDSWALGIALYELLTGGERPFGEEYWKLMAEISETKSCDLEKLKDVYEQMELRSPSFRIRQHHATGPWANVVAMLLETDSESRPIPEQIVELYQNQFVVSRLSYFAEEHELSEISLVDVKKAELEAEAREMAEQGEGEE